MGTVLALPPEVHSSSGWRLVLLSSFMLALGLPGAVRAQVGGSGQLVGKSILSVQGCGRDRANLATSIAVAGDGTWTAQSPDGTFSGTHTPRGTSGRKLDLRFDAQTEAEFIAGVAEDVGKLCEAPATVTLAELKTFLLKLNRKRTKAKLTLSYRFEGAAAGVSGTAKYRLRAKGPWADTP